MIKNKLFCSLILFLFIQSAGANASGEGWPTYGGDAGSTHYSNLNQITPANVNKLKIAWVYHSGDFSNGTPTTNRTAFEATPILWQNNLFFCTPFNRIVSLNAKTGKANWKYLPPGLDISKEYIGPTHCRGVTFWEDAHAPKNAICRTRIFEGVNDGRLIAVDAQTGKPCEDFGNKGAIDLNALPNSSQNPPIFLTSPPVVYKDVVITGSAINDNQDSNTPHGFVYGFDARTGKMRWSWNPFDHHLTNEVGAINVWAPISVDTQKGMVFLPTSSPSNDYYGGNRIQSLPYENAVVALDALTGKVLWSYQTVRHNLWDYDLPAAPVLLSVQKEGKTIPAVAQSTKTNLIFFLDRLTGKPLFPITEYPAPTSSLPNEITAKTQPIPTLPKPLNRMQMTPAEAFGMFYFDKKWCENQIKKLDMGLFAPPSLKGLYELPGVMGGNNWGGMAYDPNSNLLIINTTSLAWKIQLFPRSEFTAVRKRYPKDDVSPMHGTPYALHRTVLLSPLGVPCSPPPWGKLSAIDVNTGETRWEIPFGGVRKGLFVTPSKWGSPTLGGPLVTRGGLIFIGASMDKLFHAYDILTGKLLWETKLPADGIATPMSYAIDGKQYIVIAAGGGRITTTNTSDALIAYTLPDAISN